MNFTYLILFLSFFICNEIADSTNVEKKIIIDSKRFEEHISLLVHENLINEFFSNIGEIKGEGNFAVGDYSWYLLNPRIEIEPEGGIFKGQIRVKGGNFRVTRDLEGTVNITYDKELNKLNVEIDKADIILDVDIFGTNFVLGKVDIAKYFTKSLNVNGPQGIADEIEFKLPSGTIKKMSVEVVSYDLTLLKDAIKVSTSLGFKHIVEESKE